MRSSLLSSSDKDFQSAEKASFAVPDFAVDCSIFDRTVAVDSFVGVTGGVSCTDTCGFISIFPLLDEVGIIADCEVFGIFLTEIES